MANSGSIYEQTQRELATRGSIYEQTQRELATRGVNPPPMAQTPAARSAPAPAGPAMAATDELPFFTTEQVCPAWALRPRTGGA